MDTLTILFFILLFLTIFFIFLLIIAFVLIAAYFLGLIPNRDSITQVGNLNKSTSIQRNIEALLTKKKGIESQINASQKTLQTYEENKRKLSAECHQYEQLLAAKEKDNRSFEAKKQDLEKQISEGQKILQSNAEKERHLNVNVQRYELDILKKREDLSVLETKLLELEKKIIASQNLLQKPEIATEQNNIESFIQTDDDNVIPEEVEVTPFLEQPIDNQCNIDEQINIDKQQEVLIDSSSKNQSSTQNEIGENNQESPISIDQDKIHQKENTLLQPSEEEYIISITYKSQEIKSIENITEEDTPVSHDNNLDEIRLYETDEEQNYLEKDINQQVSVEKANELGQGILEDNQEKYSPLLGQVESPQKEFQGKKVKLKGPDNLQFHGQDDIGSGIIKQCQNCSKSLSIELVYCTYCGYRDLSDDSEKDSGKQDINNLLESVTINLCSQCGKSIPEGSIICSDCDRVLSISKHPVQTIPIQSPPTPAQIDEYDSHETINNTPVSVSKLHQMLRERRTKKVNNLSALSDSENNETDISDSESSSPITVVVQENYDDFLEEVRLRNPNLYESIKKLNQYQQKAVFSDDKKTLVSAMVGSGKTTVLIHKILYLHFIKNIPLDKMTVLTFTNKAANEIKDRILTFYIEDNNSNPPDLSYFGTFHSVARNILVNSPYLTEIGYLSNFTIMDENEMHEFYLRIADELDLNIKYKNALNRRVERYLENLSSSGYSTVLYGNMKYEDDLKKLIEICQDRKKQNNVMDFDDLIDNVILVLSSPTNSFHPQWIIVDEFQDSNVKQIEMIRNMTNDGTSIFAVGDPNQLIYSWRGSDLSIFYDFKSNGCREHYLPVNYRSTSNILNVAQYLLSYDSKELYGIRESGIPVSIINHFDSNQEAIYLANSIKILNKEGVPLREIAILFRTKRQSEIFETVFDREGIPFEVSTRQTLQDVPSLNWLTKLLKACLNKQDINSFYDAITDENYGIIKPSDALLRKYKNDRNKSNIRDGIGEFIKWLRNTNINNKDEFLEFAGKILQFETWLENKTYMEIPYIFKYFELSEYLHPTSANYLHDVDLVNKFLEEIYMYIKLNSNLDIKSSIHAAISELSLGGHQILNETIDPNAENVKLLTMHKSKGLEFRYVFISGANNGLIPLKYSNITSEELDEEKRLFFVAMTRAKDYLEISYHTVPDGWNAYPESSRFISMIPKSLLRFKQTEKQIEVELKPDNNDSDKMGNWYIGQSIKHPKYGIGAISQIKQENIFCNFGNYGEKSFAMNFLPILPV